MVTQGRVPALSSPSRGHCCGVLRLALASLFFVCEVLGVPPLRCPSFEDCILVFLYLLCFFFSYIFSRARFARAFYVIIFALGLPVLI